MPTEWLGIASIKQILGQQQAVLRLQPIYDFATGEPFQHEALLRLLDRVGNEVSPQQFLRAVVQHNLLPALDVLTLNLLESQLGMPPAEPMTPVTVNISLRSLGHPPYLELLNSVKWQPLHDRLVLELKIGDLTTKAQFAPQLAMVKKQGIGLSINYQNGGASIARLLAQLGVDYLKFDTRAFCLTYSDAEREDALAAMAAAREGHMKVIFERVETESDLVALKQCRPDYVQGHLFGFPQFMLSPGKTPLLGKPPASKPTF